MATLGRALLTLTLTLGTLAGCGGDDDDSGSADAATTTDGGIDGAGACLLPSTTITCTVGDNSPCTAMCASAYCYTFGQLPSPVCTQPCTVGSTTECPSGWTCNNMGRCRPPG